MWLNLFVIIGLASVIPDLRRFVISYKLNKLMMELFVLKLAIDAMTAKREKK